MEYIVRIHLASRDNKNNLVPSLTYADLLVEPTDGSLIVTKEELDQITDLIEEKNAKA